MVKIILIGILLLVVVTPSFAADHTVSLSAQEENLLKWQAARAGMTVDQVLNVVVNRGLAQLSDVRREVRAERMRSKFESLTPQQQADILAILGSIDE
jgi:hypothetical protein